MNLPLRYPCRHRRKEGRGEIVHRRFGVEFAGEVMAGRMPHQHLYALGILEIAASLETADADMAVRQPHHDRGAAIGDGSS